MKQLILVRHAKSSHQSNLLHDIERPLNRRGERDAPGMARRLVARGTRAELLISSPAERALTTARLFAEVFNYAAADITVDDRLYAGNAADIARIVHDLDDAVDRVMLFGHNPDVTDFVNSFEDVAILNVPTCGVVELTFNVAGWKDVERGDRARIQFSYPKDDEHA